MHVPVGSCTHSPELNRQTFSEHRSGTDVVWVVVGLVVNVVVVTELVAVVVVVAVW